MKKNTFLVLFCAVVILAAGASTTLALIPFGEDVFYAKGDQGGAAERL